jgi:transcriptional regulator with XRE-family HTH domain
VKPATPERLLKDVGRRVAELRVARGWTQEQLAELLDVGTRYVQAVESGRQNVTLKSLALFAAKLRVPAAAFFEAPVTKAPKPGRPKRGGWISAMDGGEQSA